jgi:hypothetical protein
MEKKDDSISCDFDLPKSKMGVVKKRALSAAQRTAPEGKDAKGQGKPSKGKKILYLDFDGHTVSNTPWNWAGDVSCLPANLTTDQQRTILNSVIAEYSGFDVIVTNSEADYNSADVNKRMRVVITDSWEWYGKAGGVAYIGSFTWGDNTPCFVFSFLLNYNLKYIHEAIVHEGGHTLGCPHHSQYDANCVKTSEYRSGCNMGVGYYNDSKFDNAQSSYGCTSYTDDNAIINKTLGARVRR